MSFYALGRVLTILSSMKATRDLLEKRGYLFWSPRDSILQDLCALIFGRSSLWLIRHRMGFWSSLLARYGGLGISGVRSLNEVFGPSPWQRTLPSKKLGLASSPSAYCKIHPQELAAHVKLLGFFVLSLFGPSLISFISFQSEQLLAMTYGCKIKGDHDRILDTAKKLSSRESGTVLRGALLVNELSFHMANLFYIWHV